MGREDQIEEREVLESIFPDEITDISDTEYRISIALDLPPDEEAGAVPGGDGDSDDEHAPPAAPVVLLTLRFPDDYPDRAPHLDLSAPHNAPVHPLFSVADDKVALLAVLAAAAEDNLGMAMVFTLASALREAAEQLVLDRRAAGARVRDEARQAAERAENQKFHGEPVTPASFGAWREGFLREAEEREAREEEERLAELKRARIKEPVKLSGRQLWERGLVGKVDEEDEEGVPTEELERLKVEA